MLHRRANALLALSLATLVAAVVGVQLGHSAIAEINPIHFQGAVRTPRAIDPVLQPPPNQFAQAYGWEQGYAARAYECGGDCDAREARQAATVAIATVAEPQRASLWRDATPAAEAKPGQPGETLSVERYMHYPIDEAEAAEVSGDKAADEASDVSASE